jgi:hypothetical protein
MFWGNFAGEGLKRYYFPQNLKRPKKWPNHFISDILFLKRPTGNPEQSVPVYTSGDDAGKDVERKTDDGHPPGHKDLGSVPFTIFQVHCFKKLDRLTTKHFHKQYSFFETVVTKYCCENWYQKKEPEDGIAKFFGAHFLVTNLFQTFFKKYVLNFWR